MSCKVFLALFNSCPLQSVSWTLNLSRGGGGGRRVFSGRPRESVTTLRGN